MSRSAAVTWASAKPKSSSWSGERRGHPRHVLGDVGQLGTHPGRAAAQDVEGQEQSAVRRGEVVADRLFVLERPALALGGDGQLVLDAAGAVEPAGRAGEEPAPRLGLGDDRGGASPGSPRWLSAQWRASWPRSCSHHGRSSAPMRRRQPPSRSGRESAARRLSCSASSRASQSSWSPPLRTPSSAASASSMHHDRWRATASSSVAGGGEAFEAVLAQRLEHPEPRRRAAGVGDDERLVDEPRDDVERRRAAHRARPRRGWRRRRTRRAGRTPAARPRTGRRSSSRSPRRGPRWRSATSRRAPCSRREAVVEAGGELADRQRLDPGGGELDGQREAVELAAQVGDVVAARRANAGRTAMRPLGEQLAGGDRRRAGRAAAGARRRRRAAGGWWR